jgi:hypothetical protein
MIEVRHSRYLALGTTEQLLFLVVVGDDVVCTLSSLGTIIRFNTSKRKAQIIIGMVFNPTYEGVNRPSAAFKTISN